MEIKSTVTQIIFIINIALYNMSFFCSSLKYVVITDISEILDKSSSALSLIVPNLDLSELRFFARFRQNKKIIVTNESFINRKYPSGIC